VFFSVIYLMAGTLGGGAILTALAMRDPPPVGDLRTGRLRRQKSAPRNTSTPVGEAQKTWQMWVLIASFVLISSAGLAGISKIVSYSDSFRFTATAATAAAGGIAIANVD
jgi:OFA family oxalate/formate antiporter-like MFS transporter